MPLCPLYLAGVSNGVYYYYCLTCPTGPPAAGQDIRSHTLGQNCTTILDPLLQITVKGENPEPLWLPSRTTADLSKLIEPVYLGSEAVEKQKGLTYYATFDKPISEGFHSTHLEVRATEDPDGTLVTYKDGKGKPRSARLFTLEIWSPFLLLGYIPLRMQVGQEVDPKDTTSGGKKKKGKHKKTDYRLHHRIQIDEDPNDQREFYVILKDKEDE